jgi:RNA polymerase sigma-70 factor (ECF subfamily)
MDEFTARTPDPAASPEGRFSGRERERHLRAGLRTLPEKERAALLLREMDGLSTEEVARVLGSSPATVRSQICNARVKLRKFFAKYLGETL